MLQLEKGKDPGNPNIPKPGDTGCQQHPDPQVHLWDTCILKSKQINAGMFSDKYFGRLNSLIRKSHSLSH